MAIQALLRPTSCSVSSCSRPSRRLTLCDAHSDRLTSHRGLRPSEPIRASNLGQPAAIRFWAKVEFTDTCWLWRGATIPRGYGRFFSEKRCLVLAHRWAYEFCVGPIPDGLQIDHLCRVRLCVRPDHLEPVTRIENLRRGWRLITSCPQGHPYDEENTRHYKGSRFCRACDRLRRPPAHSKGKGHGYP